MHSDDWFQIDVGLGGANSEWVGRGYWPLPSNPKDWHALVECVSAAVIRSLPTLTLTPQRYNWDIKAKVVNLTVDQARRVRSRYERHAVDDPRQILWIPRTKDEIRWGITDGES